MAAAKRNLKIEQGATFRKPLIWKADGIAVDLTGWTARMQIRPTIESDVIIAELTTENDGIAIDGPAGKISLYIGAAQTAAMNFETAVYDLELVDSQGDVFRLLYGSVSLSPEVTR